MKPGSFLLEHTLGFLTSKELNRPQNLISKNYTCHISLKSFLANKRDQFFLPQLCTGFAWAGYGEEGAGYRGGFCEKVLEALPVSDRANAGWFQDRPVTGQGWAHQRLRYHLRDNMSKKGDKAAALREKQLWRQGQWRMRGRRCSTCQSWDFPADFPWRQSSCAPAALLWLCGERSPHWSGLTPWEEPTLEQGNNVRAPLSEEEGAVETRCDELNTTPMPCAPVLLQGRR